MDLFPLNVHLKYWIEHYRSDANFSVMFYAAALQSAKRDNCLWAQRESIYLFLKPGRIKVSPAPQS